MRVALVTLGSAGDLHPFLAVARGLVQRGHEVCLFSQEAHRAEVELEGVKFRAICSDRDHQRTLDHPDLWHPIRGLGVLWRYLCVPAIATTYAALAAWDAETSALLPDSGRAVVLATPLAVGARFYRERHLVRLYSVATAPTAIRSSCDPMFIGPWQVPAWVPPWARGTLWRGLDRWKLEPMARATLTRWQTTWQTPELPRSIFGEWLLSPDGWIALFPAAFCAPKSDWPRPWRQFDFPRYQSSTAPALATELQAFLDAGPRPILVYLGSARRPQGDVERAIRTIVELTSQHDQRLILLGDILAGFGSQQVGGSVLVARWTNLAALIERVGAVIHHGGIGTCALALHAKKPQLILASAYDQHENGAHTAALQVGCWLDLHRSKRSDISRAFSQLLAQMKGHDTMVTIPGLSAPSPNQSDTVDSICAWIESETPAPF